jgi:hypothetical protein
MTAMKLSILTLYHRVFPQKWLSWSAISMAILVMSWGLYSLFITIFQCNPIAMVWDTTITDGSCIDRDAAQLASAIVHVLTNFGILLLPALLLWKLDVSNVNKWLLLFSFSIGGR